MIKKFAPVQFNFIKWWQDELRKGRTNPEIDNAFANIRRAQENFAESLYHEEVGNGFAAEAGAEYGLRMHTALVKAKNLHWLRDVAQPDELVDLALAIAEKMHPTLSFEIIEGDEFEVVTDEERTYVFDLNHFDQLSASASLALAGDPKTPMTETLFTEVMDFRKARNEKMFAGLTKVRKHLDTYSNDADVISISPRRNLDS